MFFSSIVFVLHDFVCFVLFCVYLVLNIVMYCLVLFCVHCSLLFFFCLCCVLLSCTGSIDWMLCYILLCCLVFCSVFVLGSVVLQCVIM